MGVSRSGFYRYLKLFDRPEPRGDSELQTTVSEIFKSSKETYGSRRMSKALQALGYAIGRYKARSLMQMLGLQVQPTKRFKATTNSKHSYPVAPNVLDRQFEVASTDTV